MAVLDKSASICSVPPVAAPCATPETLLRPFTLVLQSSQDARTAAGPGCAVLGLHPAHAQHRVHETDPAVRAHGEEPEDLQEACAPLCTTTASGALTLGCPILQLLFSANPQTAKEPKEIREQQAVMRSQRLRAAWRFMPEASFRMRKEYFVGKVIQAGPAIRGASSRAARHYHQ